MSRLGFFKILISFELTRSSKEAPRVFFNLSFFNKFQRISFIIIYYTTLHLYIQVIFKRKDGYVIKELSEERAFGVGIFLDNFPAFTYNLKII